MEKLTKKDIISNIAEDSHLSKKDITEVVDLALTQIFEGLSEGKRWILQDLENLKSLKEKLEKDSIL